MPKNTINTNPSKLDAFLQPSDREIDYDKYDAEKQADIRSNVDSGMIDHDAIADVEGAEAIHRILLGDEDLDTGLVEGKEALEIDTESMRSAISSDNSFSAAEKNKYLRSMQIVESIQDKGFSVIRTDSGRYWIESNENGKREYAINAIQEVADLLDKYVVDEGTPKPTPTPTIPGDDDSIPGGGNDIVIPGDNTNIDDYVPEDTDLSSSDIYYLSAIGVDLVSTMAGLGVKVAATAPTGGLGYVGGAAVSIGGGIVSTILGAIGDVKNDDISAGQTWANIGISLGLEAVEGVSSVPLGLTKNVLKGINPLKKIIRYGMAAGLVDTAASMEWDRLLSKEGEWTANDYRELATLGQFVLSGVSSYVAGRHGKKVLQRQDASMKKDNLELNTSRKKALAESKDYKKISTEGENTRKKITLENEKNAKLRSKKETDVMNAEAEQARVKINADTEAEITKLKGKKSKAKTEKGIDSAKKKQDDAIEALNKKRTDDIARIDAELNQKIGSSQQRHLDEAMKSPEYQQQLKESRATDRSRKKEYVAGMDQTKAIGANKSTRAAMGDNYSTMVGKKQRQETDAEIYSESAGKRGADKKLIAKKTKKDQKIDDSYGKRRSASDAKKRKDDVKKAEKAESDAKQANVEAKKVITKQRAKLSELEAKKAEPEGLTAAQTTEYDKLKTAVAKYDAKASKPKGKTAKLRERAGNAYKNASGKVSDKRKDLGEKVYRNTGMANDMRTSSSIAKVAKQYLSYGTNLTGDRVDKMDMRAARKTAERLGFKKNEIAKLTLRQLQAAIKARNKEDSKKRDGGRLVQRPTLIAKRYVRKYQTAGKIEDTKAISDAKVKEMIRVFDNYDYKDVKQLDNFFENNIPAGVVLTPEQSAALTQAYKVKAAELGVKSDQEISNANPLAKWKPLIENIRPSDLFMRNEIMTEVPVRKDISAPVLRARPEANRSSYRAAINSTYKQPRLDMSDGMGKRVMEQRYANAAARRRQEINADNDALREQQKNQANMITNQNISAATQAQNQNNLAANQAADIYSQERLKARVRQQTLRNKQLGQGAISLQRAGIQMADNKAKSEIGKKINTLAGLRQIYATEYAPLVDAAVKANNPFKASSIKQSFMDKHKRNPDMLNVDMLNLSDEMKLFDT